MRIYILSIILISSLLACNTSTSQQTSVKPSTKVSTENISIDVPETITTIEKSEEEWKAELGVEEFKVLRKHGTERAFSGDLLENKKAGVYVCRACQLPLFSSETKFKSGTGWPSFYQPITDKAIGETTDTSYGMKRVEVHCARCGGHQGHVFEDGPKPTGLRYCINAVSLDFVETDEKP